jgi:hypothetical protein
MTPSDEVKQQRIVACRDEPVLQSVLRPVVPERPEQDRRSGTRVSSRRSLRSPIRFRRLRMFRPKVRWMSQRSALRSQRPSLWN